LRKAHRDAHSRARLRCGELLKKIEPQQRGDRKSKGRQIPLDRKTVAREAGLSVERHRRFVAPRGRYPAASAEVEIAAVPQQPRQDGDAPRCPSRAYRLSQELRTLTLVCFGAQSSDSVEQLAAMPENADT